MAKKAKMKVSINKVYKLLAVVATIEAIIDAGNNGDPKLVALQSQCTRTILIYKRKIGTKKYDEVVDIISMIWKEVDAYHDATVLHSEVSIVVEMLYSLLPQPLMKECLKFTFTSKNTMRDSNKSSVLGMVMMLDSLFNEHFSVKATTDREKLGRILCKPVTYHRKKKTVPAKRPKVMSKAEKKHLAMIETHKEEKARREAFFASIRKRAETARGKHESLH